MEHSAPAINRESSLEADVTSNTQSAAFRMAAVVEGMVEDILHGHNLMEDKVLAWQLVFPALQAEARKLVDAAHGEWPFEPPPTTIDATHPSLWMCEKCRNINPPNAPTCLRGCEEKESTDTDAGTTAA